MGEGGVHCRSLAKCQPIHSGKNQVLEFVYPDNMETLLILCILHLPPIKLNPLEMRRGRGK